MAHRNPLPLFILVVFYDWKTRLCRWRRSGLQDLQAVNSSEDWRSEGARRSLGGSFLVPLGCLWSRTHLSLGESAEETLESDIHPLPPPL